MFSVMPNLTELCTSMPDYNQRIHSQHGIHKNRKYSTMFDFWTLVFIRFRSNVGPLALAPQKTRLECQMPLFDTIVMTISGLWLLRILGGITGVFDF